MNNNILFYLFIAFLIALILVTGTGRDEGPNYYDKGWQVPGN